MGQSISTMAEGVRFHELVPEGADLKFNHNNLKNPNKAVMITVLDKGKEVGRVWGSIKVSEKIRAGELITEQILGLRAGEWENGDKTKYVQLTLDEGDSAVVSTKGKSAAATVVAKTVSLADMTDLASWD